MSGSEVKACKRLKESNKREEARREEEEIKAQVIISTNLVKNSL